MESTINRGRAYECPYCFYKAELRKLKEHVGWAHVPLENHQFHCLLSKYVAKNERELTHHITFYLKHRQERENKVTDGTFTKNDDYLVRIQLIVGGLLVVGTAAGYPRQNLRFYGHPDKNQFLLYPDLPPLSLHLFLAVPPLSYQHHHHPQLLETPPLNRLSD